jgi:hypothetical protein
MLRAPKLHENVRSARRQEEFKIIFIKNRKSRLPPGHFVLELCMVMHPYWPARSAMSSKTALCLAALILTAGSGYARFTLVEDFNALNFGAINEQHGWVGSGTADGRVVTDPAGTLIKVLAVTNTTGNVYRALGALSISNQNTGTLYFVAPLCRPLCRSRHPITPSLQNSITPPSQISRSFHHVRSSGPTTTCRPRALTRRRMVSVPSR